MKLIPFNSGAEHDALTPWKKYHQYKAGIRKYIKQHYNKRIRRITKQTIKEKLNNV